MDSRDDDEREEAYDGGNLGAGGAGGLKEECASLGLSDDDGEWEESLAAIVSGGDSGSGETPSTPPAVVFFGSDGSELAAGEDDVESRDRGHQEGGEEDGYVTPSSPRHRLRVPEVCPPAPRPRPVSPSPPVLMEAAVSAAVPLPRGRKRVRAERDFGRRVSLRRALFVDDDDAGDLLSAFVERQRPATGKPEDLHVKS